MKKIISYEHVKRIACFLCPIICVFLYWSGTNNEIDIEKKELYNKIPNIMVYDSTVNLRSSLTIVGRTPNLIIANSSYPLLNSGVFVRKYYTDELKKLNWQEVYKKEQFDREGEHIADIFFFTKDGYTFSIRIEPPIKKFREISDIKTYVKLYRPRYTISIGKNEMFFKHEFKRSGLSASIGGQVIDKGNEVVSHVERAN